jgi:NitT/TauT family transport system substrate-binding protein
MSFPGDKVLGDKGSITLRFDPTFMQLAADGAL